MCLTVSLAAGMGQVHCGLWEGLQQEDPGVGGASVLDTIVKVLLTLHLCT